MEKKGKTPFRKRKRIAVNKVRKKSFDNEIKVALAASDKGSYYNQDEFWDDLKIKKRKIILPEDDIDCGEEIQEDLSKDDKLHTRYAVLDLHSLNNALTNVSSCKTCSGTLQFEEDMDSSQGLGASIKITCSMCS